MLNWRQILLRSLALGGSAVVLAGCGQTGPLYLPTGAAAADRATLPQSLWPRRAASAATGATPSLSEPSKTP